MVENPAIDGTWELVFIDSAPKPLAELYPDKIPTMEINTPSKTITGNTGCNSYSTALTINKNSIDFSAPIVATERMCMNTAEGEALFLGFLPQVNNFAVSQGELYFMKGNKTVMRFRKS